MKKNLYHQLFLLILLWIVTACHDDGNAISPKQHTCLFWTSLGSSTIECARIENDTIVEHRVLYDASDGLEAPSAICIDEQKQMIYWTDFSSQQIMRAPWSGDATPEVLYTVPATQLGPVELALDPVGHNVYWTQPFDDLILRAPTNGRGVVDTLFSRKDGINGAWGIGLQLNGDFLYWVEFIDVELHRAHSDGTGKAMLYAGGSGFLKPYGLAIDENTDELFILDNPLPGAGLPDRILKGNVNGKENLQVLYTLNDGVSNAYNITIDKSNGKLYWHNQLNEGSIFQGSTDGNRKPIKLVANINIGQGLAIAHKVLME